MSTSLPELRFRHQIVRTPIEWNMTYHEDRTVSPGVPDLHYVIDDTCRVGWLELKASFKALGKANRIKVEPSQHQYIRKWGKLMPIHFLIKIKDWIYLVPGAYHAELPNAVSEVDMKLLSVLDFHEDELTVKLSPFLRKLTQI